MPAPLPPADCRLYLITPPRLLDPAAFARSLEEALSGGDVAALQVRLKEASALEIAEVVRTAKKACARAEVALILNDDPTLAAELYCDGVHIGQSDASLEEARRIMGRNRMVGVTCHDSRDLAYDAAADGADYVAFGAFFPTDTKKTIHRPDTSLLTIWQETMEVPCVAIGGITVENARGLIAAGADFLAVSAGIWTHADGPGTAVERLNTQMKLGLADRPGLAAAGLAT